MKTSPTSKRLKWMGLISLLSLSTSSFAIVQDAAYYRFKKAEQAQWLKDDEVQIMAPWPITRRQDWAWLKQFFEEVRVTF